MNFLAHLTVPGQTDEMLMGNFMADAFKGRLDSYPDGDLKRGMELHRAIDDFADSHPISKEIVAMFRTGQGKYAGVTLDILYDHLLAKDFEKYHGSLRDRVDHIYDVLRQGRGYYQGHAALFLPHMIENDLLYNYQYESVIRDVLHGMSRRTRYDNNMHLAFDHWAPHLDKIQPLFEAYYEEFLSAMSSKV